MNQSSNLKILSKVSKQTVWFFGTKHKIRDFLDSIAVCGSVAYACTKMNLSPMEVQDIIAQDVALHDLVSVALKLALEIAEGKLYDRAVNGYIEETIMDGIKVGEKKKYSDSCLISYLKANSSKYNPPKPAPVANTKPKEPVKENYEIEVSEFE